MAARREKGGGLEKSTSNGFGWDLSDLFSMILAPKPAFGLALALILGTVLGYSDPSTADALSPNLGLFLYSDF